jgi:hypothetical protein
MLALSMCTVAAGEAATAACTALRTPAPVARNVPTF